METKKGYVDMSPRGRLVCEFVELSARHRVRTIRAKVIPGLDPPNDLAKELKQRYQALSEGERAAITDLLSPLGHRPRWASWLKEHLPANSGDAQELFLLEQHFAGVGDGNTSSVSTFVYQKYGSRDYPWKMQHAQ